MREERNDYRYKKRYNKEIKLQTKKIFRGSGFFEFLIPMFPHDKLDSKRVREYENMLHNDSVPTVVSLSVLEYWQPATWEGGKEITEHWCLAHYLIDGHHKIYAAAKEGVPITLISFLAIEHGLSSSQDIKKLIKEVSKKRN